MQHIFIKACLFGLCLSLFTNCETPAADLAEEVEAAAYTTDWADLARHDETPEWFADSKLGIYFHWGPYTVPAFGSEWYPRNMYMEGSREFVYHQEHFGDQATFGYHDFVPQFTAEKFDPEEWADIIQSSGAKWAGPVAQHHDGFAMWDSEVNPWNAADMGPKRDITGEMLTALRERNMKTITSFHHARNLQRNADTPAFYDGWSSHYPYHPDWATSSTDEQLRWLYGNVPADEWHPYWFAQLKEVIDQYSPDIIWFDVWLSYIPEQYRQDFCAYYLNHAKTQGQEVVIAHKKDDLPIEVSVLDIEQGGKKDVSERIWLTDITLSNQSWSYVEGQTYKSADLVIRNFIDVVSKNGVVLLNISPKADGSIPVEQQSVLKEMGEWLATYGDAIYNTRARLEYGHGSAKIQDGHFGGQSATNQYGPGDIRYTEAKDHKTIYAIFLGPPTPGETVKLKSLELINFPPKTPVKSMRMLGSDVAVDYRVDELHFEVTIPTGVAFNEIANVIKIELE